MNYSKFFLTTLLTLCTTIMFAQGNLMLDSVKIENDIIDNFPIHEPFRLKIYTNGETDFHKYSLLEIPRKFEKKVYQRIHNSKASFEKLLQNIASTYGLKPIEIIGIPSTVKIDSQVIHSISLDMPVLEPLKHYILLASSKSAFSQRMDVYEKIFRAIYEGDDNKLNTSINELNKIFRNGDIAVVSVPNKTDDFPTNIYRKKLEQYSFPACTTCHPKYSRKLEDLRVLYKNFYKKRLEVLYEKELFKYDTVRHRNELIRIIEEREIQYYPGSNNCGNKDSLSNRVLNLTPFDGDYQQARMTTRIFNFEARAKRRIIPSFGYTWYFSKLNQRGFSGVLPYAGAQFEFTQINKRVELDLQQVKWWERLSLYAGLTLSELKDGENISDLFGNKSAVIGVGVRPMNIFRVNFGGLVFKKQESIYQPNKILTMTPTIGISIDADLREIFK